MLTKRPQTATINPQSHAEKIRQDARRFVDALAARLGELETMARLAKTFEAFNAEVYADFKRLYLGFSELCEEFQVLSHLTEESLSQFERAASTHWQEHQALEDYFRRLQVPMLHAVIRTNLRLLQVWEDRLRCGEGLPYGAHEVFLETVRIIRHARAELLRPRYVEQLEEAALADADCAEQLLRTLLGQAPQLFDFAARTADPAEEKDAFHTSLTVPAWPLGARA